MTILSFRNHMGPDTAAAITAAWDNLSESLLTKNNTAKMCNLLNQRLHLSWPAVISEADLTALVELFNEPIKHMQYA